MSDVILNIVKEAAKGVIGNMNLTKTLLGTIKSVEPLEVEISPKFVLPEELLLICDSLLETNILVEQTEYIIHRGLEIGEKVALIRFEGGHQYLIMDRVSDIKQPVRLERINNPKLDPLGL